MSLRNSNPRFSPVFVLVVAAAVISLIGVLLAQQSRPRRGGRARNAPAGNLTQPPLARNETEKRILAVLEKMWRDRSQRHLSVSETDGRLLRQLTEAAGAKLVVEIGTSTGYSGLWFTLALKATGGKLITHELDPGRAELARSHFKKAGVDDIVTIVVGNAHETVKKLKGPIDVLFLDADKPGYIDYLKRLLPLIRPGGLILAHNMHYPPPDPRYIEAITKNPELETTFLLMEGAGIGFTLKKR